LFVDSSGVKVVPQKDNFPPQLRIFNLEDTSNVNKYSIHTLFKYMSHVKEPPIVKPDLSLDIDVNNGNKLSTSVLGLGLKLNTEGKLVQGCYKNLVDLQIRADAEL